MKLETIKYQLAIFIRYAGDAFIYPFLALYFSHIGLDNSQIGLIMMILPLVAIFINPIWSTLSKNINSNRHFVRILSIIEAIAAVLLVHIGTNIWLIVLIVFIIGVVGQPIYILLDSILVTYARLENYEYSKIRLFGSFAYMVTVLFSGMIAAYSYKLAFIIGASLFTLTSLLITWIKPLDLDKDMLLEQKAQPKLLMKNKKYWAYVMVVTLTLSTMFVFDTYLPVFLKDLYGFGEAEYGYLMAGFIAFELVILLILSRVGKKIPNFYLYLGMILSLVIRFGIYALSQYTSIPIEVIVAVTMLRSIPISFSIYMMMVMITKLVAPFNVTFATTVMSSIRSIYTTILVLFGGYLTKDINNYKYWFLLGAGLAILTFAFIDYKNSMKVNENVLK